MAELKTQPTTASVTKFIAGVTPERRRHDALAVMKLMKQATGKKPKLWGANIVGYGTCRIRYASGRELEWMLIGFSPAVVKCLSDHLKAANFAASGGMNYATSLDIPLTFTSNQ